MGDCEKWMTFNDEKIWFADAGVVAAAKSEEVVFMSGQMSGWYNSSLGLTSVYRALLLLKPGVLLVVDHIETKPNSPTRYVGAIFHNRELPFELKEDQHGETVGSIILRGKRYLVLLGNSHRGRSIVHSQQTEHPSEGRPRNTNFLNITTRLKQRQTRLAYVFVAPENNVTKPQLQDDENGVHVSLEINELLYDISIATKFNSSRGRHTFLGFDGFTKVQIGEQCVIKFGLRNKAETQSVIKWAVGSVFSFKTNVVIFFAWILGFLAIFRSAFFKFRRRICTIYLIFGLTLLPWIITVFS